jgi:pimeloyl-ACP methyl ester carboxylesterase
MTFKLVQLTDGYMHVFDEGTGPPLMFVHGFPLDHRMWKQQIKEFSRSYRVIAPDLRGFGKSSSVADDATLTMRDFADDLAEMLSVLEIDEPVCLIGLSMGGYIAFQFWEHHRDRLSSLVLCDTRSIADSEEARTNRFKTAQIVLEAGSQPLAEAMSTKLFAPDVSSSVLADVKTMIVEASPAGIAAASRGMAERPDVTDRLSEVELPALVVVGSFDSISSPEEMRQLANGIPGSEFAEIPDAGHMSPMENPDAFNRELTDFLEVAGRA